MAEEKREFISPVFADSPSLAQKKKTPWLNILLFVLTILSTFFVGITWSLSYKYADNLGQNSRLALDFAIFRDPEIISLSLVYALVLMIILLGHEFGHYLTCRHYQVNATLPYFIPAPTLVGTLGAFIKIKSPITLKKQLFDIGIAGPLAGFILSLPALVYGLALSKLVPALPRDDSLVFGEPLLLKLLGSLIFKNIPPDHDLILHPVAFAGWVGVLVTSYNLFPMGQLDGGHISYALIGSKSKQLAKLLLVGFVVMGVFFWVGWFVWALIILLLGLKHPRILDEEAPLSLARKILSVLIIIVFILSFIPDPVKGYNIFDLWKQFGF
jgi:membrane-associated protease RseP (regulator of RpoE activity)